MAGGAGIQNRHRCATVLHHVQHTGQKIPGVQCARLARLQIHRDAPRILCASNAVFQRFDSIAGAGDVMPAAEVHPLHFWQYIAEFFRHSVQRHRQRVGVLLAQGVEMQPVQNPR